MKLIKLFLGFLFILSLFYVGLASATSSLPYGTGNTNSQYYSVVFDKEQEAAVIAKLTYTNLSQEDIKNLALEIPGSSVRIISIIQEKSQEAKCSVYDRNDYNMGLPESQRSCYEWAPQVAFASIVRDEKKDQKSSQSLEIDVPLKEVIKPNNSGTVIIYYKTKGFVAQTWNGYKYAFETIKSPYDIDDVRVAINVADDLYLKDTAKAATNYQEDMVATSALSSASFAANPKLATITSNIAKTQGVVKETTSLDPNENYKVEGKYYNNQYMGQLPAIIGVGITFLIIIFVLIIIIRNEKK